MNWYAYAATAATWTLIGYIGGRWVSAIRERNHVYEVIDELERIRGER